MLTKIARFQNGLDDRQCTRAIDSLERVRLNGVDQWILLRGESLFNPVLLLIQAGPGLPMIHEAQRFARATELEKHFTLVYWDQRGCGKSYSAQVPQETMKLGQLVADTVELSKWLSKRLAVPQIYLGGFSMGGTVAILTGASHPELFAGIIAIGPDLLGKEAETFAYEFALSEARSRKRAGAERDLKEIGPPPHDTAEKFATRVKWVANFGGVQRGATYSQIFLATLSSLLSSPHYSLQDVLRTIKGVSFGQQAFAREMGTWDLFERVRSYSIPLAVFQGRWDRAAKPETAERFIEGLPSSAPKKIVWFHDSAHSIQWEESERFRDELLRFREEVSSSPSIRTAPSRALL